MTELINCPRIISYLFPPYKHHIPWGAFPCVSEKPRSTVIARPWDVCRIVAILNVESPSENPQLGRSLRLYQTFSLLSQNTELQNHGIMSRHLQRWTKIGHIQMRMIHWGVFLQQPFWAFFLASRNSLRNHETTTFFENLDRISFFFIFYFWKIPLTSSLAQLKSPNLPQTSVQ